MKYISGFLFYFLLFIGYSFLGWIIESVCCSINDKKLVLNRGFLIGPYLPIFGFGSLIIIIFFQKYADDVLALFIIGMVFLTILEYITSYIMEKIFKTRWWDYYDQKFNINGRVSLKPSLAFGLLSVILIEFINPFYLNILNMVPVVILNIISTILLVIFLSDFFISLNIIFNLTRTMDTIKKDITGKISEEVKKRLKNRTTLTKRLLNAYPKAYCHLNIDLKKVIDKKVKK